MGYCHYCKLFVPEDCREYVKMSRWMLCFHRDCYMLFTTKLSRLYGHSHFQKTV